MSEPKREEEHRGPIWKHPYFAYVILTMVIFGFLLVAGYLGTTEGWIPTR